LAGRDGIALGAVALSVCFLSLTLGISCDSLNAKMSDDCGAQ